MNKTLLLAGIAVAAASKAVILKSILIDMPAYQKCLSGASSATDMTIPVCGTDPFFYFIFGWFITIGGFILIVFGLRMPATRSISR